MNDLNLTKTQSTPAVSGSWEAGVLKMDGDSYPENSYEFFGEVIAWIERFLGASDRPLRLELRLVYMNTSSVKAMMDIFDLLAEAHGSGRDVAVNWYYDPRNERVAELAGEFKEDCEFPFVIAADA
jgi:Domain of unknown function (DUF1987).